MSAHGGGDTVKTVKALMSMLQTRFCLSGHQSLSCSRDCDVTDGFSCAQTFRAVKKRAIIVNFDFPIEVLNFHKIKVGTSTLHLRWEVRVGTRLLCVSRVAKGCE